MTAQTATRVFTRNQYVRESIVSHHDYFAQFVTEDTIAHVSMWFDPQTLTAALAKDEHLNSIPLATWDALSIEELNHPRSGGMRGSGRFYARIPLDRGMVAAAQDYVTRADLVCVAKCAAKIIIERHAARQLQAA